MKIFRALIVALAGLMLATPLASAGSIAWYLSDEAHPTLAGHFVMSQEAIVGSTPTMVVPAGGCTAWAADFSADVDVAFPTDGWSGTLTAGKDQAQEKPGHYYPVHVGHASPAGFTDDIMGRAGFLTSNPHVSDIGNIEASYPSTAGTMSVLSGEHLTFKFCNDNPPGGDMDLAVAGFSFLSSPYNSPPYPTPELPTLVLMGMGLLGLVGFAARKR